MRASRRNECCLSSIVVIVLIPIWALYVIISGINLVGSSRDSFSASGGPSGASMGRCYACGQATYPALPLGPSGATVAPMPIVPCPSVGGFLPVSSSPPAPPVGVSENIICKTNS